MKAKRTSLGAAKLTALIFLAALSAVAVSLSQRELTRSVHSAGHTFVLPATSEISRTLLSDGRILEVHGAQGIAYLVGDHQRKLVRLPEVRRFASVTVMPGGQVLLWGGVDSKGQLLRVGEWFDPASARFVTTGVTALPARAGHTLTVLTSGELLMAGGWSAQGGLAEDALLLDSTLHVIPSRTRVSIGPRIGGSAQLQADGSVLVNGGVDGKGRDVSSVWSYDPVGQRATAINETTSKPASKASIAETFPGSNGTGASIQGPLVVRFASPVDVRQLNEKTVTLLGPEGDVPVRVYGAEGGRLAFVQLPDELYPGSRYTLFVKGLHTAAGDAVPYTAVGFATASIASEAAAIAGNGNRRAAPETSASLLPPLYVMAGGARSSCTGDKDDELCRTRSFINDGAWYPGQDAAPDATGAHWRLYHTHQSLPDTRSLEADIPKGATALVGQVRQIDEKPVANVELSIGDMKVRTDAHGVFVFEHLSSGRQEMFVDGGAASHGNVNYGRFLVGADVKANVTNHMPFVMYLPRILPRDEIKLPSPTNRELVLTHPDMPGLELHVPAGAVFKDHYGHVLDHIAIVPTPVDHAPFPLPDNFPMYFTIQPGDAVVDGLTPDAARGIRVVYPNYGHAKAKTTGNFWVYDAKLGWKMYGGGHVTDDAKQLAPDPGVSLVWAMGAGASLGNSSPPNNKKPDNKCLAQPVDLQTGILFHEWNDLSVNDIMPLTVMRAYNSADSASHAFGIGGTANFGIHLYSSDKTFTQPQLVLPCGEGIVFNLVTGSPSWSLNANVY